MGKAKILNNLIVLITLLTISHSSIFSEKYFVIGFTFFLLIIFYLRNHKFDKKLFNLIFLWYLINIIAIIILGGQTIPFVRISSSVIVFILFPYLVIKIIGIEFWGILDKWIFNLTTLSLPIFLLNFLAPSFFDNLFSVFHFISNKAFSFPFWSALIYVNTPDIQGVTRNCGFMWEPGAFAMMIIWNMIYDWRIKGLNLNSRFYISALALVTTFSTAGYLAFLFIVLGKFIKKISFINILAIVIFGYFYMSVVMKQEFMGDKLSNYITTYQMDNLHYSEKYDLVKVNRLQGFYYSVMKTIRYPFGYGVISNKDYTNDVEIYGTNGLGSILTMWGVIPFIYFLYIVFRFMDLITLHKIRKLTSHSFFIAILLMFFSNPISRNTFIYLILITFLIHNKQKEINI
jgi:hypothetical protein